MIYHPEIEQGTEEWKLIKAGRFSSSKAAVIMGGLDTSGLASYIQDLAWERVYGPIDGGYKNSAMERGHVVEPDAREWYSFVKGSPVEQCGFVQREDFPNCGWSPDGLLMHRKGAIEAKCPLHKAWMECKRTGKIPSEYRWQTKFALWIGQLDWLDFISYHPLAGGLIVEATVTETEMQQMAERVTLLEAKVQSWVNILQDKKEAA